MKKFFVCSGIAALVMLVANSAVFAQEVNPQGLNRDALITNLTALRNQELRVAILQQLVNEEGSKLLRMQAVFSDRYNLDPDKLRSGLYRYDDETSKFVEQKSAMQGADMDATDKKSSKAKGKKKR